jgi:hypothetical protein
VRRAYGQVDRPRVTATEDGLVMVCAGLDLTTLAWP